MSTPLFKVRVLSKKDNSVTLRIKIVNPSEYYFYEKKNFALQLLWEAVQIFGTSESSLAKEIPVENIINEKWVLENEDIFIHNVNILSTKNYPAKDEIQKMNRQAFDDFRKKNGIPEADFLVEVSDKKWIGFIREGMEWESASYDMEP